MRKWLQLRSYKRRYRQMRLAFRAWRHRRYIDFVTLTYRLAKRLERWAEPRLRQGKPEALYPIAYDRYSRL